MNNELVFSSGSKVLTNSVLVAKKFGKEHRNVLSAIRAILEEGMLKNEQTPMFEETTYVNEQNGQTYPMFIMNRDGFTLLAMGFTGKQAMQFKLEYIGQFNKMEATIKNSQVATLPDFTNPAEAARAWAEQFELKQIEAKRADEAEQQVLLLSAEVEKMQPKVSYYDKILASKTTMTTTQIAQDYGMSAVRFNKILEEFKVQRKVNGQWILYAPFIGKGYVHSKPFDIRRSNGQQDVVMNTEWTQKGRLFLYDGLKNHGILPLIEQ